MRVCEECQPPAKRATVLATLRPVDWDGHGREPVEKQFLCDECLARIPEDERISVRMLPVKK